MTPVGFEFWQRGSTAHRRRTEPSDSRDSRPPARPLVLLAPAKLNLGLWILRRRPDGYHNILTIFQAVDLYDTLSIEPSRGGVALSVNVPGIPVDDNNLVVRAARALLEEGGLRRGAMIHLEKRIPHGAGLGGGSSDAAAALVGLNRVWGLNFTRARLARLALRIGSDVPFFLVGGRAVGRGRGQSLTRLRPEPPLVFVVLHSPFPVDTKSAYSRYQRELTASLPPHRIAALSSGDQLPKGAINALYNALEPGLAEIHPDIRERCARLVSLGALQARMTGSGSSVYGVFLREDAALRAAEALQGEGYRLDLCRSIAQGVVVVD